MSLKHIGVVAALTALATAAHGQDGTEIATNRTPANAQRFLSATPPEKFSYASSVFFRDGDVASSDACKTTYTGKLAAPVAYGNTYRWQIQTTQSVARGAIGIELDGRRIVRVLDDTSAKKVGLRKGDEIVTVDGNAISSIADMQLALTQRLAGGGASSQIAYLHDGKPVTIDVPIMKADDQIVIPFTSEPASMTIDWSKVEAAEGGGTTPDFYVNLKTPGDAKMPNKAIYYSVAATRDRVLAAAQYLQQACDRSKELGF